jgi:chemotaxis protein methyltransferase CheR
VQQRYFDVHGREFTLIEPIKSYVRFEERNLVDGDPSLWPADAYDIVFCRNVLMYLAPERAREMIERIARSLLPGGYAFLGHAETLRGLSNEFHLCHTHGTFYYQRRSVSESRPAWDASSAVSARATSSLATVVESSSTWIETIHRASERIRDLSRAAPPPAAAPPVERGRMSPILELVERERYADALERVHTLPPESARDPDVLLLRAVLLTHGGLVGAAAEVCNELLAADEFNAGAHYVLALCREAGGDLEASVSHDQVAVYLDPSFAMPHLHMGLLARRSGDGEAARRELSQALSLLKREDASRLLLFGGGFGREALAVLCRTELVASGGAP